MTNFTRKLLTLCLLAVSFLPSNAQRGCDGCCKCTKLGGFLGENFEDVRQFKGSDKGTEGFKLYRNAQLACKRKCISRQNNQPLVNLNGKVDPLTKNECTVYCRRASNGNKKTNRKYCEDKKYCRKPVRPLLPKLAEDRGYSILVAALNAADLVETLEEEEPLKTLFAPTDEAFGALPDGVLECLLKPENKDALVGVLTNHVVGTRYSAVNLPEEVTSLAGFDILIERVGDETIIVGGQTVVAKNRNAKNGILHAINGVILPDESVYAQCLGTQAPEPTLAPTVAVVPTIAPAVASGGPTPRPSRTKRPTTPRPTAPPIPPPDCEYQREVCIPCIRRGCYFQLAPCLDPETLETIPDCVTGGQTGACSDFCRDEESNGDKKRKDNCQFKVCKDLYTDIPFGIDGVKECLAGIDAACPAP